MGDRWPSVNPIRDEPLGCDTASRGTSARTRGDGDRGHRVGDRRTTVLRRPGRPTRIGRCAGRRCHADPQGTPRDGSPRYVDAEAAAS